MKIILAEHDNGWEFTVDCDVNNSVHYRTNRDGEGLWIWTRTGSLTKHNGEYYEEYDWKQIEGTSQFSLPRDRKKAYDKIRRLWMSTAQSYSGK